MTYASGIDHSDLKGHSMGALMPAAFCYTGFTIPLAHVTQKRKGSCLSSALLNVSFSSQLREVFLAPFISGSL